MIDSSRKILEAAKMIGASIGNGIAQVSEDNSKLNELKLTCKQELQKLSKLLSEQRDNITRDRYFFYKSECSNIESKITRIQKERELNDLIEKIRNYIKEIQSLRTK